jgi:hypothetical protein
MAEANLSLENLIELSTGSDAASRHGAYLPVVYFVHRVRRKVGSA